MRTPQILVHHFSKSVFIYSMFPLLDTADGMTESRIPRQIFWTRLLFNTFQWEPKKSPLILQLSSRPDQLALFKSLSCTHRFVACKRDLLVISIPECWRQLFNADSPLVNYPILFLICFGTSLDSTELGCHFSPGLNWRLSRGSIQVRLWKRFERNKWK